jgi:outer membrane protein OmpA-like peptidoglycan-associated protein
MHRSQRFMSAVVVTLTLIGAAPAFSQSKEAVQQAEMSRLQDSRSAVLMAANAGAELNAKALYDDAKYRLQFAESNWNASKKDAREEARLKADEAYYAARAAEAKARWIGANTTIRNLQSDIVRFGGRSDLVLQDESPTMAIDRGADTKAHIAVAQAAIDQAIAAGADRTENNDLGLAQKWLNSAKQINRAQKKSDTANHLAYDAEMMARRAFYWTRLNDAAKYVQPLQLERTRMAQAASEAQAAAERRQREEAERQAAALRQQLLDEQNNRQAQQAELDKLREQIEATRQATQQRLETERAARLQAEANLDQALAKYEGAIATGNSVEIDALRRQVEDHEIMLRATQERERLAEQALGAQIEGLRGDLEKSRAAGTVSADALAAREAELKQRQDELAKMRTDRETAEQRRVDAEKAAQAAISEAQRQREEADRVAQAAVAEAQRRRDEAEAQTVELKQQVAQQSAELQQTRQELSNRDAADADRMMRENLSKLAKTSTSDRGLIVTLPGLFFDTGKTSLKPGAKATLKRIALELTKSGDLHVAVEGHTDSVGSEETNMALSEKRAAAVKDYLTAQGVPADRISSSGKGEAEPVASNKTAAGRQQNRRVELIITR